MLWRRAMQKHALWLLFTIAFVGCAESPADSLQGLTSTFPCLANNIGLNGDGNCAEQDKLVLAMTNGCSESVILPAPGGTSEVGAGASRDYSVPTQFVTG